MKNAHILLTLTLMIGATSAANWFAGAWSQYSNGYTDCRTGKSVTEGGWGCHRLAVGSDGSVTLPASANFQSEARIAFGVEGLVLRNVAVWTSSGSLSLTQYGKIIGFSVDGQTLRPPSSLEANAQIVNNNNQKLIDSTILGKLCKYTDYITGNGVSSCQIGNAQLRVSSTSGNVMLSSIELQSGSSYDVDYQVNGKNYGIVATYSNGQWSTTEAGTSAGFKIGKHQDKFWVLQAPKNQGGWMSNKIT
eukprot:TRINITY_DN3841_c0_g1_i1.p1 TRINITY_DN3841_c0_g1~~TRINITY_DN3841_c0_g1_i1.p1  ORF type:complete len:248 (+),score=67.02 TRINITY_DN3841_c0_g1_i1:143-886(+)